MNRRYYTPSFFPNVPGDLCAGNGLRNQFANWWSKQYRKSVSRPEIPQDFMAHAVLFLCVEKSS